MFMHNGLIAILKGLFHVAGLRHFVLRYRVYTVFASGTT